MAYRTGTRYFKRKCVATVGTVHSEAGDKPAKPVWTPKAPRKG